MRHLLSVTIFSVLYLAGMLAACNAVKPQQQPRTIAFRDITDSGAAVIRFDPPVARVYKLFTVDEAALFSLLRSGDTATLITLPLGSTADSVLSFSIRNSEVLPPEMASRYPDIHTYKADDRRYPSNTVRIGFDSGKKTFEATLFFRGQRCYLIRRKDEKGENYYYFYNIKDFIQKKAPFEKGEQ